jgi:hypothetical protein
LFWSDSNELIFEQKKIWEFDKMSTNEKVSKREVSRWVKWLKEQGYSGPFIGIKPSYPPVKLLAKELRKDPPTILETRPRDPRTIVSNLTRFITLKDKKGIISKPSSSLDSGNFLSMKYLSTHYEKLCKLTNRLDSQLGVPDLRDLCLIGLGTRTKIPHRYAEIAPIIYDNGLISLEVEDSDPFLWKCLRQHLTVELPDFERDLNRWKVEIASIVERSHRISNFIAARLTKMRWNTTEANLSPDSKYYVPGVYSRVLNDLLYECVLINHVPRFQRVPGSRNLLLLVMECPTQRKAIARGDNELFDEIEKWCLAISRNNSIRKRVGDVRKSIEVLEVNQKTLKEKLRIIWERGTFKGVCSVCSNLIT